MHGLAAEYKKNDGPNPDYYIKWESLPYAEATWEDGNLIVRKWPQKIKEFRDREDSRRTPSKHSRALKYRPKFNQLKAQPEYMGGDQVNIQIMLFFWTLKKCLSIFIFLFHNVEITMYPRY